MGLQPDMHMTSIITGDIINSRSIRNQQAWLRPLKQLLQHYGKTPKTWEIYRGDSFQVEVKKPQDALLCAVSIKACIKAIKGLDVRLAIGIGVKSHNAARITEANGTAFIHSGETFELLKKQKRNLAMRSPWPETDKDFDLILQLASAVMDKWSTTSAETMLLSLSQPGLAQKELSERLGIGQSSVSERQTRAHYHVISEVIASFHDKIRHQTARL
jgi:hypothetical protein